MSEPQHEELFARAVGDFRAAAMPAITPPGPAGALRRARARRRNRVLVLCTVLALLTALPAAVLAQQHPGPAPVVNPSATPSPSPSSTASPSATATPSGSPSPSPARVTPSAPRPTTSRPTSGSGSGSGKNCRPGGYISVVDDGPPALVEVDALPNLCAGEKLYFFWAVYRVQDANTLVLTASGRGYVDHAHVRRSIGLPGWGGPEDVEGCTAAFVVQGRGAIKSTIPWSSGRQGFQGGSPYAAFTPTHWYPFHSYCDPA
ncbi:hypothetical protein [Catellatospora vulcania]|uniref:hypothetical protein n=1 Tax=Catellatospora vulcania TaxID=1460450 RepID=UPI0012D3C4D4|nr:hypothetical protein [Catellatospora vulcania]